jgi:adenosylcobinamide kinase/adenosylcobinamide-phosphate guanylyltransferase
MKTGTKRMTPDKLILVLGGARSGKSNFAQELARNFGSQVVYIATAQAKDEEMRQRIIKHQASRPSSWHTIEETHRLEKAIREHGEKAEVIIVDCLTLWISNLLLDGSPDEIILRQAENLVRAAKLISAGTILVANEVGLGLVPDNALGRIYRDVAGRVNQLVASQADKVYFVVAGLALELKSLGRGVKFNAPTEKS